MAYAILDLLSPRFDTLNLGLRNLLTLDMVITPLNHASDLADHDVLIFYTTSFSGHCQFYLWRIWSSYRGNVGYFGLPVGPTHLFRARNETLLLGP